AVVGRDHDRKERLGRAVLKWRLRRHHANPSTYQFIKFSGLHIAPEAFGIKSGRSSIGRNPADCPEDVLQALSQLAVLAQTYAKRRSYPVAPQRNAFVQTTIHHSAGRGFMSRPFLLSVVIPNRNRATPLLRAILSLPQRSPEELDVIVVDDFSQVDLSTEYAYLESLGVRVIRQDQHLLGGAARNRGMRAARGTHVCFLDSDDIWLPCRYDELRKFFSDPANDRRVHVSNAELHVGNEVCHVTQPEWRPGSSLVDYVYRDAGRVQTSMLAMPVDIAREHPFDESLRVNQDTDLAMRMDRAGIGFRISPQPCIVKEETPKPDRVTTGRETADLSLEWYLRESHDWSAAAKSGYHLQDRVWRLADSGHRGAALIALGRTLLPPVSIRESARRLSTILLGPKGYARLRNGYRTLAGRKIGPDPSSDPTLVLWRMLTQRAENLCETLHEQALQVVQSADAAHQPEHSPDQPATSRTF
ncbi:MAG: glycosyltransferase family 2 protein, partial [Hyphomicrobiaceae bacterium]